MDRESDPRGTDVKTLLSIVIPVRNEADNVQGLFYALANAVHLPAEVLLVYDDDTDSTLPAAQRELSSAKPHSVRFVRNDLGPGPANALRSGFAAATGEAVVVVMADLSDNLTLIPQMVELLRAGSDVVCPSRYMPGGGHIGGPWLKRTLSRWAGLSLHALAGLPTRDATNSFRLYRTSLLRALSIQSRHGFEVTLEITAKAWANGYRVVEIPTTWVDRVAGGSHFRLLRWLPHYVVWYLYCLSFRASYSREQTANGGRAWRT